LGSPTCKSYPSINAKSISATPLAELMRGLVHNSLTFLSFIVGRVGVVVMLFGAIFIIVVLFILDGLVASPV
jgi:hypothetical protein